MLWLPDPGAEPAEGVWSEWRDVTGPDRFAVLTNALVAYAAELDEQADHLDEDDTVAGGLPITVEVAQFRAAAAAARNLHEGIQRRIAA